MTPDEYAAKQAVISAAVAYYVHQFGQLFTGPPLSLMDWLKFLRLLFPEVQRRREESAALARDFFDSERELHHPKLPRHDVSLVGSSFQRFVQDMDPARQRMSLMDSPDDALGFAALRAVREVENAGRKQIIRAVETDPLEEALEDLRIEESISRATEHRNEPVTSKAPKALDYEGNEAQPVAVKGWARVATGRETCAWCLMLVSRGPVYRGADTAGLDLPDWEADEIFGGVDDLASFFSETEEYMNEWHAGCDCKVVPVYDVNKWPGINEQKRAEKLWIDASNEADRLIESGKSRTDNRNRETLNALRRRLYRGGVDMSEFAALAA